MTVTGKQLKEYAMRAALAGARPDWKTAARAAVESIIAEGAGTEFTSEDVWPRIPTTYTTGEPRAIGPIITPFANAGRIEKTGRVVNAERPESHCRPLTIWRVV